MAWLLQQMHLMFAFDNTNRLTCGNRDKALSF